MLSSPTMSAVTPSPAAARVEWVSVPANVNDTHHQEGQSDPAATTLPIGIASNRTSV
jgi:hypothetical protein